MHTVFATYLRVVRCLTRMPSHDEGRLALLLALGTLGCGVEAPTMLDDDAQEQITTPSLPLRAAPKPSLQCGQSAEPGARFLDVGHAISIDTIRRQGDRILSSADERWILWDATAGRQVTSGMKRPSRAFFRLDDLANATVMTPSDTGFDLRRASNGEVLAQVALSRTESSRGGLSSDGSFAYVADRTNLRAWDLTGRLLFEHPGDYLQARIVATASELRIGDRAGVVETIALPTGTSTVAPAHQGRFYAWFLDGSHYLTAEDTALRVYTSASTLVRTYALPKPIEWMVTNRTRAGGDGAHLWIEAVNGKISLYGLDKDESIGSFEGTPRWNGGRAALQAFQVNPYTIRYLDLRGTPKWTDADVGHTTLYPYSSTDANGGWALGDSDGIVFAGTLGTARAKQLGCGRTLAIATSRERLAVATSDQDVRVFDFRSGEGTLILHLLNSRVRKMAIGANDDLLVMEEVRSGGTRGSDSSLEAISLRSGSRVYSWGLPRIGTPEDPRPVDFAVAAKAERVARSLCQGEAAISCIVRVDALDGTELFRTPPYAPLQRTTPFGISPSGKRVAVVEQAARSLPATTLIYEGSQLVGKVANAAFSAWLDEERLIVEYSEPDRGSTANIVDVKGDVLTKLGSATAAIANSASVDPDYYLNQFGQVFKSANAASVWNVMNVYKRPGWRLTGYGLLKDMIAYGADSFVLVEPFR